MLLPCDVCRKARLNSRKLQFLYSEQASALLRQIWHRLVTLLTHILTKNSFHGIISKKPVPTVSPQFTAIIYGLSVWSGKS